MRPEFKQAKDIFLAAVQKANPEERAAFLHEACAGNDGLRQQVDGQLRRHEDAGSFLEHPPQRCRNDVFCARFIHRRTADRFPDRSHRHENRPVQARPATRRGRHGNSLGRRAD